MQGRATARAARTVPNALASAVGSAFPIDADRWHATARSDGARLP